MGTEIGFAGCKTLRKTADMLVASRTCSIRAAEASGVRSISWCLGLESGESLFTCKTDLAEKPWREFYGRTTAI